MGIIETTVKLRISTHLEFKIQAGIFLVQALKFDFKRKDIVREESLKSKDFEKFSSAV